MSHLDPPATAHVAYPSRRLLQHVRPSARLFLRRRYDVRLHGTANVPTTGPDVLAANHIGVLDGPLLGIFAPRPVHALTKQEMFRGRTGRILIRAGQIPIDRFAADPRAIRISLRVLRDGGVLGVFPEGTRGPGDLSRFHHGAAYLALVSGATVVPVIMLGTREPGGGLNSTPPRGSRIDIWFGAPEPVTAHPWPRTPGMVQKTSALLKQRMEETLAEALSATGRSLPGPLPAGEAEPDPDTGFIDEGAP